MKALHNALGELLRGISQLLKPFMNVDEVKQHSRPGMIFFLIPAVSHPCCATAASDNCSRSHPWLN